MAPAWDSMVWELVACIPKGKVATYGQLAKMLGFPRRSRHVGFALGNLPEGSPVPWQRVINSQGRISFAEGSLKQFLQRRLLEEEGVDFTVKGAISLKRFGWQP